MPTDAQQILIRALEDEEFRARLEAAATDEERLAIARAEGYDPDPAEGRALRDRIAAAGPDLTSDELGEIVGGSSIVLPFGNAKVLATSAAAA